MSSFSPTQIIVCSKSCTLLLVWCALAHVVWSAERLTSIPAGSARQGPLLSLLPGGSTLSHIYLAGRKNHKLHIRDTHFQLQPLRMCLWYGTIDWGKDVCGGACVLTLSTLQPFASRFNWRNLCCDQLFSASKHQHLNSLLIGHCEVWRILFRSFFFSLES